MPPPDSAAGIRRGGGPPVTWPGGLVGEEEATVIGLDGQRQGPQLADRRFGHPPGAQAQHGQAGHRGRQQRRLGSAQGQGARVGRPQPRARTSSSRSRTAANPSTNGRSKRSAADRPDHDEDLTVDEDDVEVLDDTDDVDYADDADDIDIDDGDDTGGDGARAPLTFSSLKDKVTSSFSALTMPPADRDSGSTTRTSKRKEVVEPEIGPDGLKVPRWGLGDVAIAFVLSVVAVIVSYLPLQALGYLPGVGGNGWPAGEAAGHVAVGQAPTVTKGITDAPIWLLLLFSYVPLWFGLMVPTAYAVWRKGNGFVKDLGLRMEWLDIPLGLAIGVGCQLVVVPLIYLVVSKLVPDQDVTAVARQLTDRATDPLSTVLIFLIVGIGAPVVEEIYYRGLTLRAAERRFGPSWALVGTSAYFAIMHGALIVLPGLIVFAVILGYLAQRFRRLGPSIFAHIGFNLVTAAVLIFNINLAWLACPGSPAAHEHACDRVPPSPRPGEPDPAKLRWSPVAPAIRRRRHQETWYVSGKTLPSGDRG